MILALTQCFRTAVLKRGSFFAPLPRRNPLQQILPNPLPRRNPLPRYRGLLITEGSVITEDSVITEGSVISKDFFKKIYYYCNFDTYHIVLGPSKVQCVPCGLYFIFIKFRTCTWPIILESSASSKFKVNKR